MEKVLENEDFKVFKVADGIWLLSNYTTPVEVSIYVIEGENRALVFDAGHSVHKLRPVIESLTKKPYNLILTHGHVDHVNAINEFEEVYMSKDDEFLIPDYKGKVHYVEDGQKFDLGGRTIEAKTVTGHTPGSIGYIDSKTRLFITGDAIGSSVCWMMISKLPLEAYIETLNKILSFADQFDGILVGHYFQAGKIMPIDYVKDQKVLAQKIVNGEDVGSTAYDASAFGVDNALIAKYQSAGLIYCPNRVHYI